MKNVIGIYILLVTFSFLGRSQISTVNFSPTDDSYTKSSSATTNYGSIDTMLVYFNQSPIGNSIYRSFIQFDLSSIPANAIIVSAKLKLYPKSINNTLDHPIYIQRADSAWTESSINWNNAPDGITSGQVSVTHSNTTNTSVQEFTVTSHVEYMTDYAERNHGWRIRLQSESGASSFGLNYYTSEYSNAAKHPSLEVKYILPVRFSTQVSHCTPGNTDGAISVNLSGGTQIQSSYFRIDKVVRDTTKLGEANLTNVTSGSSVSYSSGTKKMTASNLAPGVYRLYVNDSLYSIASDPKYRFYCYFLVGREGETTTGILLPSVTYQENVRIARDKPGASSPTDLLNTNQSAHSNLYVNSSNTEQNEYASLIQYYMDFDPTLEFEVAELTIKAAAMFYRGSSSSNDVHFSLVTSPWDEKIVTWYTRPTIDSALHVYIPATIPAGSDSVHLFDTVSIIPLVEYWQQNPTENYGFELALLDYSQPNYVSRNYKSSASNENFIQFDFKVRSTVETVFYDSLNIGDITINAPFGNLPYTYLIGYDTIPVMDTLWYAVRDSVSIDSASFYQGDINSRNFTFSGLPSGRYFVGVYDNNGDKILDVSAVLSPEIFVYYSVDMRDTLDVLSVQTPADSARGTLLGLLPMDEDGGFEFEVANLDGNIRIGFNREFDTIPYMDRFFEYSIEVDSTGDYEIRESGSLMVSGTTIIGDRFKMVKYKGEIIVFKNGVEIISDTYPILHRGYKVEVILKGAEAAVSKPAFIAAMRRPKTAITTINYPECPDGLGSIVINFPSPTHFKEQNQYFTITEIHTGWDTTGTGNGTFSLPIGVYSMSYYTEALIGMSWVSLVGGSGSEYFTIGYPIEWNWNPIAGNITEVIGTLNTIIPTVANQLGTAYSANRSEFDVTNWIEFNKSGPFTTSAGGPYVVYPGYVIEVGLNNTGGSNPVKVEIYNPGYGVISGYVSIFNNGVFQTWFTTYYDKPIRIEFDTDITGASDNFLVYHNGDTWTLPGATATGQMYVLAQEIDKVALEKSLASFCPNVIPEQYVTPKRKLEGGYYKVPTDDILMFEFYEEYTESSDLKYIVRDYTGTEPWTSTAPVLQDIFGDNRRSLDVSDLAPGFYVLEIYNDKNEKWFLRFQVQV